MISEVVDPPDRLRERAQELAETIAKNSPAAMAATKKALWARAGARPHRRVQGRGAGHLVGMWGHPDQDEGPRAFAEKRDPVWLAARREPRVAPARSSLRRRRAAAPLDATATMTAGEAAGRRGTRRRRPRRGGVSRSRGGGGICPNGPDLVVAMMGVWIAGGVYVPVNPRLPVAEVDAVLDPDRAGRGRHRSRNRRVGTPIAPTTETLRSSRGRRARPARPTADPPHPRPRTSSCWIGSSARCAATANLAAPPTPNLIPVSMALNAGLYNALFGLRAGAALVIMDRFEPQRVRRRWWRATRSAPRCCHPPRWWRSPTPT